MSSSQASTASSSLLCILWFSGTDVNRYAGAGWQRSPREHGGDSHGDCDPGGVRPALVEY